jgi:uncharacterized membrane protein
MIIAWPLHIVAVIVWLGGLFWLSVTARPSAQHVDAAGTPQFWQGFLSRFFVPATIAIVVVVASGIAMVKLKFGGFAHMPHIHRANMAIGLPAIGLYVFLVTVLWRRYRRAGAGNDRHATASTAKQMSTVIAIIMALGVVASVVSAVGRYL